MVKVGNMETRIQTFRGNNFLTGRGNVHPEYSFDTFTKEENDFRNEYWDIKSDDVVFDIGSSYGSYTLTACAMGAQVYAFEPESTVFCDLVTNIKLNSWYGTRCIPTNIGLWSSATSINMKDYAPHWPQYTISSNYSAKTIDQVAQEYQISRLDWMKVDVEGAEEHVILGGLQTIKKFHPKLIIECHTFLDAALKDKIKTLLSPFGYNFEEVSRDPCVMLICK
jgi:FkbM family methyltransferase